MIGAPASDPGDADAALPHAWPGIQLSLAGLRFCVGPAEALSSAERSRLLEMGGAPISRGGGGEGAFALSLVQAPPWAEAGRRRYPDRAPAGIEVAADRVRLTHARFLAELEPARRRGRIYRSDLDGSALELTLRVALTTQLPSAGGIGLHAAGVEVNGAGLVFFGPSGAGKSTLAGACPWRVYSDELVGIAGRPFQVGPTGFWGMLGASESPPPPAPLAALVELAKGPGFALEELTPALGLRRLLGVAMVPPETGLWREALAVLGRLVREVPVLRMTWTPEAPPWSVLEERLAPEGAARGVRA